MSRQAAGLRLRTHARRLPAVELVAEPQSRRARAHLGAHPAAARRRVPVAARADRDAPDRAVRTHRTAPPRQRAGDAGRARKRRRSAEPAPGPRPAGAPLEEAAAAGERRPLLRQARRLKRTRAGPVSDPSRRLFYRSPRVRVAAAIARAAVLAGRWRSAATSTSATAPAASTTRTRASSRSPRPRCPMRGPDRFSWPLYGYTKNHTRFFPAPAGVRPPFRQLWVHNSHALLEFPPVIYGDHIFQLADNGVLVAHRQAHRAHVLEAPARRALRLHPGRQRRPPSTRPCSRAAARRRRGASFALNYRTGQTRWSRNLSSRSESSPLLDGGTRLLRLPERHRLRAQRPQRQRHLDLPRRRLGQGEPDALAAACSTSATTRATCRRSPSSTGPAGVGAAAPKARCSAAAPSTRPPPSSTAASSSATPTGASTPTTPTPAGSTGRCRRAPTSTASPAVTNAPGLGPTIYLGSYDGTFYAFNARTGHVSWSFNAHGRISGSATIIGRIVYFADLGEHPHLRPRHLHRPRAVPEEHRRLRPGDQRRPNIYLTGYTALYGLAPIAPLEPAARARAGPRRARSSRATR